MYPYMPASMAAVDDPARPDGTTIAWIQVIAAVRDQISAVASRLGARA